MALTPEILIPRLGDMLVEQQLITADQLVSALAHQNKLKETGEAPLLGQLMIEMGFIDQKALDQAITQQILHLQNGLKEANATLEKRVFERTAQLEEAYRKLSVLNELKSNFVANISHELRTPLTHIIGYVDLLLDGGIDNLSQEQKESIKTIKKASGRLDRLIEDLILFSTSEVGNISIEFAIFNLITLVNEVITKSAASAQKKKISLGYSCDDKTISVRADRTKIFWVLNHLLENAIKFTPEGGKVNIQVTPADKLARITVEDSGIGIASEKINEIFEPFHQLDGSSTRKQGGTGLGLTLVKKILEAHSQTIEVKSTPGKGSSFVFSLERVTKSE